MSDAALSCWVISDGRRGIENQALGLAEAAGRLRPLQIRRQQVEAGGVFKALPPTAQHLFKHDPEDYGLDDKLPDMAIGCGRQAIAPLIALKDIAGDDIFSVYIQDPRVRTDRFDLVIAPEHDGLSGDNVETMIGSPNRITEGEIIGQTLGFAEKLARYPMPRVAMLIGGKSNTHKLGKAEHAFHMQTAKALLEMGKSLLITTSRRTPDWAIKDYQFLESDHDHVWLYDGNSDENPYFAFLGGADQIFVTEDSTNMLTEACASGKPVFRLPMEGEPGKFKNLYNALKTRCHVGRVGGNIHTPEYDPLDETARIAERLWVHYDRRRSVVN